MAWNWNITDVELGLAPGLLVWPPELLVLVLAALKSPWLASSPRLLSVRDFSAAARCDGCAGCGRLGSRPLPCLLEGSV